MLIYTTIHYHLFGIHLAGLAGLREAGDRSRYHIVATGANIRSIAARTPRRAAATDRFVPFCWPPPTVPQAKQLHCDSIIPFLLASLLLFDQCAHTHKPIAEYSTRVKSHTEKEWKRERERITPNITSNDLGRNSHSLARIVDEQSCQLALLRRCLDRRIRPSRKQVQTFRPYRSRPSFLAVVTVAGKVSSGEEEEELDSSVN